MVDHLNTQTLEAPSTDVERRNEQRTHMCKPAELWMFDVDGEKRRLNDVVAHNSCFGGLAIIARLDGAIRIGRPVELVLRSIGDQAAHIAGTITFCRSAGPHYFDIGICVKATGSHWIVADDVSQATARYDWFSQAIRGNSQLFGPGD